MFLCTKNNGAISFQSEWFSVSYKLFSYETDEGRVGIVSIRGSFSLYDWLNNIQSWTKPVMFQIARSVLPLGFMWNDIFPRLCSIIGMLETESKLKYLFVSVISVLS